MYAIEWDDDHDVTYLSRLDYQFMYNMGMISGRRVCTGSHSGFLVLLD